MVGPLTEPSAMGGPALPTAGPIPVGALLALGAAGVAAGSRIRRRADR